MSEQSLDQAVPTLSVGVAVANPKATSEMWQALRARLDPATLPAPLAAALDELCAGTSAVEPTKPAIDVTMLHAGVNAMLAHGSDIAATVVEIYKAMRGARP